LQKVTILKLQYLGHSDCQKALLPQTDRATRYVSQNLVNWCTIIATSCTSNPQQIEATELEHYGRLGDAENARHEIAGHENAAPECKGEKCET